MCGIVGVITRFGNGFSMNEAATFQDMLFVDTMRGWDSTGVFGVDNSGNLELNKAAIDGPSFIKTQEFKDFKAAGIRAGQLMVGHNRAATRGSVKDENAHPFCVDDKIVLVQNGTYKGEHKHLKDTAVDTEAIAHVLAEHEDIEDALQRINAAYALVWYNTQTKCLHMIRNDERPLHCARTKGGSFIFASEMETILYAASRNSINLEDRPYLLKPKHLVTFKFHGATWELSGKDIKSEYNYSKYSPHNKDSPYYTESASYNNNNYSRHSRIFGGCGDDIDNEWDYHTMTWRNGSRLAREEPKQSLSHDKRKDNTTTINEIIAQPLVAHYIQCDPKDDQKLLEYVREQSDYSDKNNGVIVELFDYYPANKEKDCQLWYVYGHILDPEWPEEEPAPVIYWMRNGDEDDAMRYATHSFYRVKIGTGAIRYLHDNQNHRKCAVLSYGRDPIPVHTETHEAVN